MGQSELTRHSSTDVAAFKMRTHDIMDIYITDHGAKSTVTYLAIMKYVKYWQNYKHVTQLGMMAHAFQPSGGRKQAYFCEF